MKRRHYVSQIAAALALAFKAASSSAQTTVPVVTLPDASAKSVEKFGGIVSVRELPGGKVLVNDAGHRQVKLVNAALASSTVVIDSAAGVPNAYGIVLPMIPYLADSTLLPDQRVHTVTVLGPDGAPARSLSMPNPTDMGNLRRGAADNTGRLIFPGIQRTVRTADKPTVPTMDDSVALIRTNFATRVNDTIAYVSRPMSRAEAIGPTGTIYSFWNPDPLKAIDEWVVLTDGSVAIVRGHDYKVDFIRPDGTKSASAKLPFDSRQLSDADKAKMVDSSQVLWAAAARNNTLLAASLHSPTPWALTGPNQEFKIGAPGRPVLDTVGSIPSRNSNIGQLIAIKPAKPSVDAVFDYYPPIRSGAVLADLDNQLWILPSTSKQSKAGELVYDVVSTKGELVKRVRMPIGRLIVGFGKGGVVYMVSGGYANGFTLERTKLPAGN